MTAPLTDDDPREVGGYRLLSRLGAGGMGVVYLATTDRGTPVAVKVLHAAADRELRSRFRHEVEASLRVASPWTARVLDADVADDVPFLVTEHVAGPTLAGHVEQHGLLAPDQLVAFAAATAQGMAAIHQAGITHRDLTPANVILSPEGPKLVDLGIALVEAGTRLTQTGTTIGTPGFMSPEQARGADVGGSSDVFSWGAIVTFAGTGRPPFGTGRTDSVLYRVVHEAADTRGLVPDPLRRLVEEVLVKDPLSRPTARDLVVQLVDGREVGDAAVTAMVATARLGSTVPLDPVGPTIPVETAKPSRRRNVLRAATVAVTLALAGAAGWAATQLGDDVEPEAAATAGDTSADPTPGSSQDPRLTGTDPAPVTTSTRPADDAAPQPRTPEAPWDVEPVAPSDPGLGQAASWWSEWMDASCPLYWPVGVQDALSVQAESPVKTRVGDVQLLFWDREQRSYPLAVHVWPADHPWVVDVYADHPDADITYADGTELRSVDEGPELGEAVLAFPGTDCFYYVTADNMAAYGWGVEGLRPIDVS